MWEKHRSLATGIARSFYVPGAERQDVEQEALIGLWDAARMAECVRRRRRVLAAPPALAGGLVRVHELGRRAASPYQPTPTPVGLP